MASHTRTSEAFPALNRTVKTDELPIEVWANVLGLGFTIQDLFSLCLISRKFFAALQIQGVWRKARQQTYGYDFPRSTSRSYRDSVRQALIW